MTRKIIAIASIIAIIAIVFTATSNSTLDESTISKTIFVDAVYEPESEIVKFLEKSLGGKLDNNFDDFYNEIQSLLNDKKFNEPKNKHERCP